MTSTDDSDAFLLGSAAGAGAGPCPDAGQVAGFAEGTLLEAEADRVAAHAASCATCRAAIADLAGEKAETAAAAPPPRGSARVLRLRAPWIAAAAVLVLAVGALLVARSLDDGRVDPDARLAAAARELAAAEPTLFGGFAPLGHDERAAVGDGRERGGLRLLVPTGVVLSKDPAFRWVAVPGAASYEVSVVREGGAVVWTRTATGTVLPYPKDVPPLELGGRYAWSVATNAVLGGKTEGRRTFAVASPADVDAFTRAREVAAKHVAPETRDLLVAHWAFRRGLFVEAERLVRTHLSRDPQDAAGRETLQAIRRSLGAPDGDAAERPK